MVRFRYIECVAIDKKKAEKNFFEKGKVKKQKKMREERKIEKVLRLVIGNIVRHKCIIFIKSVLNCIKFSYKLLFRNYSLSPVVVAESS